MKELIDIQRRLKAPKSQFNKFGNYAYRSCEDILEALKPLLSEHECQLSISDEIILIGERYYIKAIVTLTNTKGDTVRSTAYAREPEDKKGADASQITGMSSSYARKYALNGMFLIDDNKDADYLPSKEEIEKAVAAAKAAKTVEEVTTVWNDNVKLHANDTFKNAVAIRGQQLKEKKKDEKTTATTERRLL